MKKLILIAASLSVAAVGGLNAAELRTPHERIGDRLHDTRVSIGINLPVHPGPLRFQIRHLNKMRAHLRDEISEGHAGRRIRARFREISNDVDRVNFRYQRGRFNPIELKMEVHRLRERLHRLERDLRLRRERFYIWR